MRVKLIGVSDEARKSESVARAKRDRRRLIAPLFDALGEAVRQQRASRLNVESPHLETVNSANSITFIRASLSRCNPKSLSAIVVLRRAARVVATYKYCRTGGGALI